MQSPKTAKWQQKTIIENTWVLCHITRSFDKYLQEPLDTFKAICGLLLIHSSTLLEVKHTRTHKVVDYITHWPLGSPVNIIDSRRILALPTGLREGSRSLSACFLLFLPLSQPIIQKAPSNLSQICIHCSSYEKQNCITPKTKSGRQLLRYTCGLPTGKAFQNHAIRWTRWIHSHMQEHTTNIQRTRDTKCGKTTLRDEEAWCHPYKVVNSTTSTVEGRPSGRGDSPTQFICQASKSASSNKIYWSTQCVCSKVHNKHIYSHSKRNASS